VPALIALVFLLTFGNYSKDDLYLRWVKPSKAGVYLIILTLISYAIIGSFGRIEYFSPLIFFIAAPLSAITQEFYFRCSLQTVFEKNHNLSRNTSNILQCLFFSVWHLRLFIEQPHPTAWLILTAGLIFYGLLWGYHSRKDHTSLYVILLHTFGLMLHSIFVWELLDLV
jgi:hypothetical protein